MKEHGAYLFNKLVAEGIVERASGKLMVEKIKILYPDLIENIVSESELDAFQPPDATIYPIAK